MTLVDHLVLGIYIGVLTGIFAAVIIYSLTILFTYLTDSKLPVNMALMIGLGIAGVAGGPRLFLRNPEMLQSTTAMVMVLVLLLISLYAHKKAQDLGKALPPKNIVLSKLRTKTFSPGVVKQIGKFGQVDIRPTGEVADMEGYPPLSEETRQAIRTDRWSFPADLPIPELETRLEEKLQKDHNLADAIVTINADGGATISAAPTTGGLSRRVPDGKQVVVANTMLPSGIAAGDTVRLHFDGTTVNGQVVSTRIDDTSAQSTAPDEASADEEPAPASDGTQPGGNGRVAIAVDPGDVQAVVGADPDKFYVQSRGRNREYELLLLLRRDGNRFHRTALVPESAYLGRSLGELNFRAAHGVVVLALRRAGEWRFAPDYTTTLRADDELFLAGPKAGLDALQEEMA